MATIRELQDEKVRRRRMVNLLVQMVAALLITLGMLIAVFYLGREYWSPTTVVSENASALDKSDFSTVRNRVG